MAQIDSPFQYWSLTSNQLAAQIKSIADAKLSAYDDATRSEAKNLSEKWQEALSLPKTNFAEQSRRATQLAALQKRTIPLLLRLQRRATAA